MERDEHIEEALEFISMLEEKLTNQDNTKLNEALYTFSELGLFDGMDIQEKDAIRIWAVVESVIWKGFPDRLRM